eukprot:1191541-Prorocentrum_minimum.AAC.4
MRRLDRGRLYTRKAAYMIYVCLTIITGPLFWLVTCVVYTGLVLVGYTHMNTHEHTHTCPIYMPPTPKHPEPRLANTLGGKGVRLLYDVLYNNTTYYTTIVRIIQRIMRSVLYYVIVLASLALNPTPPPSGKRTCPSRRRRAPERAPLPPARWAPPGGHRRGTPPPPPPHISDHHRARPPPASCPPLALLSYCLPPAPYAPAPPPPPPPPASPRPLSPRGSGAFVVVPFVRACLFSSSSALPAPPPRLPAPPPNRLPTRSPHRLLRRRLAGGAAGKEGTPVSAPAADTSAVAAPASASCDRHPLPVAASTAAALPGGSAPDSSAARSRTSATRVPNNGATVSPALVCAEAASRRSSEAPAQASLAAAPLQAGSAPFPCVALTCGAKLPQEAPCAPGTPLLKPQTSLRGACCAYVIPASAEPVGVCHAPSAAPTAPGVAALTAAKFAAPPSLTTCAPPPDPLSTPSRPPPDPLWPPMPTTSAAPEGGTAVAMASAAPASAAPEVGPAVSMAPAAAAAAAAGGGSGGSRTSAAAAAMAGLVWSGVWSTWSSTQRRQRSPPHAPQCT